MYKERPDSGRFDQRIESSVFAGLRLIAAIESAARAPATGGDRSVCRVITLDNEVGPVGYELRIDAEDVRQQRLDLPR